MGFKDETFFNKFMFHIDPILGYKEYTRLLTSGFLHVDLPHLLFNMFSFYSFSAEIEKIYGIHFVIFIYFISMIGGSLFSLSIHKIHPDYSAAGASGAVSGIIFASIFLLPGGSIGFFFIPISIPAEIYGILFIIISMYGIKSQKGNIGHEAHLGGALTGMLILLILAPKSINNNKILFTIITTIITFFIIYLFNNPVFMPSNFKNFSIKKKVYVYRNKNKKKKVIKNREKLKNDLNNLFEKAKEENPKDE